MRNLLNKKGVTLMEVMFVTIILVVGLLAVGTAMYGQFFFVSQIRNNSLAALAAQEVVESIRTMDFDSIIGTDLNAKFNNADDSRPQVLSLLNSAQVSITKDNDSYGDPDNIRRISAVVSWASLGGGASARGLTTLMTRDGMNNK